MIDKQVVEKIEPQLIRLKKMARTHPLICTQGSILGSAIELFILQSHIQTVGKSAPLLTAFKGGLIGIQSTESTIGFIGPEMYTIQQALASLISPDIGVKELFLKGLQISTLGIIYLSSQTLAQWKTLFKQNNPLDIPTSGSLYRELGLLFLTASGAIDAIFKFLASAAGFHEKILTIIGKIGRFYLLLTALLAIELEQSWNTEELQITLTPFLVDTIEPIDDRIKQLIEEGTIEQNQGSTLQAYLQAVKNGIENHQSFVQMLGNLVGNFGISKAALLDNIQNLIKIVKQLGMSITNISSEAGSTTSITQMA